MLNQNPQTESKQSVITTFSNAIGGSDFWFERQDPQTEEFLQTVWQTLHLSIFKIELFQPLAEVEIDG